MSKQNNMGTYLLTPTGGPNSDGVYTIQDSDGVYNLALLLSSAGAGTYTGAAKIGAFGDSVALDLVADLPTNLSNPDPIDGLTITITAGTCQMITNQ